MEGRKKKQKHRFQPRRKYKFLAFSHLVAVCFSLECLCHLHGVATQRMLNNTIDICSLAWARTFFLCFEFLLLLVKGTVVKCRATGSWLTNLSFSALPRVLSHSSRLQATGETHLKVTLFPFLTFHYKRAPPPGLASLSSREGCVVFQVLYSLLLAIEVLDMENFSCTDNSELGHPCSWCL